MQPLALQVESSAGEACLQGDRLRQDRRAWHLWAFNDSEQFHSGSPEGKRATTCLQSASCAESSVPSSRELREIQPIQIGGAGIPLLGAAKPVNMFSGRICGSSGVANDELLAAALNAEMPQQHAAWGSLRFRSVRILLPERQDVRDEKQLKCGQSQQHNRTDPQGSPNHPNGETRSCHFCSRGCFCLRLALTRVGFWHSRLRTVDSSCLSHASSLWPQASELAPRCVGQLTAVARP